MSDIQKTVPKFDGTANKFALWWVQMCGYCNLMGFGDAFNEEGTGQVNLPESEAAAEAEENAEQKKKYVKAVEKNNRAVYALCQAFNHEDLVVYYNNSKCGLWPHGRADRMVQDLLKDYRPKDKLSLVEAKSRMAALTLEGWKENIPPKEIFTKFAKIRSSYETATKKMDESDIISNIVAIAPRIYREDIKVVMKTKGEEATVRDYEEAFKETYRIENMAESGEQKATNTEVTLSAFTGTCYRCNKPGHKSTQCKSKELVCRHCKKKGHVEARCWSKPGNEKLVPKRFQKKKKNDSNDTTGGSGSGERSNAAVSGSSVEYLLSGIEMCFPDDLRLLENPNIFIGDTGATNHVVVNKKGCHNIREAGSNDTLTVENGDNIAADAIVDLAVDVCSNRGESLGSGLLKDAMYASKGKYNLFSLSKCLKDGWTMRGDKEAITLVNKAGKEIKFDIKINTTRGVLFCIYLKRKVSTEVGGAVVMRKQLSPMEAHRMMGHVNDREARKSLEALGYSIDKGKLAVCEDCTVGKAKQKNIKTKGNDTEKAEKKINDGRVFLDIASVRPPRELTFKLASPHMRIIVSEKEQLKVVDFYPRKNDMVEPTIEKLQGWISAGVNISIIRLDNAGENTLLEKRARSSDWKLNINFEYTARNTPQQNHLAEVGLTTIVNRGRSMMVAANVPTEERYRLFGEAFKTASLLDALVLVEVNGKVKSRAEHFLERFPVMRIIYVLGERLVLLL